MVDGAHNLEQVENQNINPDQSAKRIETLEMPPLNLNRLPPHARCEEKVLECKRTITMLMREAEGFRRVAVEFGRELMNTETQGSDGRGLIVNNDPYAEDDATWIRYPDSMETAYTQPFPDMDWDVPRMTGFINEKYTHHVRRFLPAGAAGWGSADRQVCRIPNHLVQKARMRYTYVRGQMHKKIHHANKHRMLLLYVRLRDGGNLPNELQHPFDKHLPDRSSGGSGMEMERAAACYRKWFEKSVAEYGHLPGTYEMPKLGIARINPHPGPW